MAGLREAIKYAIAWLDVYGLGTLWLVMVVWYFNIPELAIAVSTVNLHTTHDSAPYTRLDDRSSNVLVLQQDLYRVSAS